MTEITKEFLKLVGCASVREFKVRKRRELAALHKALNNYRLGCAYCPEYGRVASVQQHLDVIKSAQSVKSWGR